MEWLSRLFPVSRFSCRGTDARPHRKAHTGCLGAAVRLSRSGGYPWGAGRPQRRRVARLAGFSSGLLPFSA